MPRPGTGKEDSEAGAFGRLTRKEWGSPAKRHVRETGWGSSPQPSALCYTTGMDVYTGPLAELKECDVCGNQAISKCYIFGCERDICVVHRTSVIEENGEVTYRCPDHVEGR